MENRIGLIRGGVQVGRTLQQSHHGTVEEFTKTLWFPLVVVFPAHGPVGEVHRGHAGRL